MKTFSCPELLCRALPCLVLVGAASWSLTDAAAAPSRVRQVAARSMIRGYQAEPLASDAMRAAERGFLEKATAAGRLQLRLAELGASQGAHTDVRSHAEQLKSDNRQLVEALTALMRKKGVAPRADAEPVADAYTRLAARTGAEFDREFVRVMAEVHEETIALFEQAAADAKDTDVRELAAAQIPMLRGHRNRITELKKAFD